MTVLATSTFTGANGAAWPAEFALGRNPTTGGGATIQSNTGRLQTGTAGGYVFGTRIARRVAGATVKDQDVTFRFSHDGTECYPEVWLRSNNPELDGGTGYTIGIDLGAGQITLRRQISFVTTTLGSPISKALTSGSWYRLRVQAIGTSLRVRVWNDGDAEPSTWNVNVADGNIITPGYTGWSVGGGGSASASNFFVDDFEQTDGAVTAPPPTAPSGFTGWGVPAKVTAAVAPSYTVTAPAPTVTMSGTTASVSVTVTVTGGPVLFDTLQIELVNAAGGVTTVGTRNDVSVTTTQALTGAVSLAVGTYTARVAYTLDGTNWVYLTPEATFTVSSGTTPPPTGTGTWLSGASGDDYAALGTARGRAIEVGGTWANVEWPAIAAGTIWGTWTKPIDVALQDLLVAGESWASHAARSFVDRYDQALNGLKAALGSRPQSILHIRPWHEFNLTDMPWQVSGANAANFVAAWRILHERKQLILPGAKMVWSPGNGTSGVLGLDVRTCWPGSAYVNVLGVDYYNGWPGINTQAEWDANLNKKDGFGAPVGLGAWLTQAGVWGVPMALSEWGGHATEGGDYPNFFSYLYGWMKTNGGTGPGKFWYEVYFNIGPNFALYPTTTMPLSWVAYQSLWSTGVTPPPPDPETEPPPTGSGIWGGKTRTISMWDMSFQPAPFLRDYPADVKAAVDLVVLGLAQHQTAGTGYMRYAKEGQSVADHAADIREFQSRGVKVVMGYGGSGAQIVIQTETQVTQAMSSITGFVNTYGINGIDCDLEPSGASWTEAGLVSLHTQCRAKWGPNFILGITPGLWGSHTAKWFSLVRALGPSRYDYFAPMEYDYPESQDARLLPIWAYKIGWMIDAGIPANKIIMGCMMQPHAGYSATINPQTILNAWNQEVAKRSTLRGVFEWESRIARARNWDLVRKMQGSGQFNT